MSELRARMQECAEYIESKVEFQPEVGIILGTGLGTFASEIEVVATVPYSEIPNFPVSTVMGHKGQLVFGHIAGKKVVAMQGRFHLYEGYSAKEVTFPVRVLKALGIETLLISNAAGGINAQMNNGDLMLITDHINFQIENPLRGENDEELGPRFPDMSDAYSSVLLDKMRRIISNEGIDVIEGVYLGLQGPNLETKSEYRAFHLWGADAVGMSTVPEVLVANHMSLPVLAMSVITNVCYPPERVKETTHEEVIEVANAAEPKLARLFKGLIAQL